MDSITRIKVFVNLTSSCLEHLKHWINKYKEYKMPLEISVECPRPTNGNQGNGGGNHGVPSDSGHGAGNFPCRNLPPQANVPPPPRTLADIDFENPDPPKDAIEPTYLIETTFLTTFAGLQKLYQAGLLIKNSFFKSAPKLQNEFPTDPSKIAHIFRIKEGHVPDTLENRNLILEVANNSKYYLGDDNYKCQWFAKLLGDGRQAWARVRGGKIINGGINKLKQPYNEATGLNNPTKPVPNQYPNPYKGPDYPTKKPSIFT